MIPQVARMNTLVWCQHVYCDAEWMRLHVAASATCCWEESWLENVELTFTSKCLTSWCHLWWQWWILLMDPFIMDIWKSLNFRISAFENSDIFDEILKYIWEFEYLKIIIHVYSLCIYQWTLTASSSVCGQCPLDTPPPTLWRRPWIQPQTCWNIRP